MLQNDSHFLASAVILDATNLSKQPLKHFYDNFSIYRKKYFYFYFNSKNIFIFIAKKVDYNYIVIEGCIGAGKTCFTKRFAEDFNAKIILEQFADNSFLPKFYEDPERYAFPLEMSFLTDRYGQLKNMLTQTDLFANFTVADYFIDKCAIFSQNNLKSDEYSLYLKIFEIISSFLPRPELIVYFYKEVDILLSNIKKRGRDYEQNISGEYLHNIQQGYLNYFKLLPEIPIIIVDTNHLDFVQSDEDYNYLVSLIQKSYNSGIHRITSDKLFLNSIYSLEK